MKKGEFIKKVIKFSIIVIIINIIFFATGGLKYVQEYAAMKSEGRYVENETAAVEKLLSEHKKRQKQKGTLEYLSKDKIE